MFFCGLKSEMGIFWLGDRMERGSTFSFGIIIGIIL